MKKTHVAVTGQEALNQHSWNCYRYFEVDRGDGERGKKGGWLILLRPLGCTVGEV